MHTPLFSSSCVDWEKLMSVVHALSLDAATARSGRRWCLGRLNHKTWWLCSLSGLCLWGPCTDEYLIDLFSKCGFTLEEICVHNKQFENHSLDLVMNSAGGFMRHCYFSYIIFTDDPCCVYEDRCFGPS
ncbi:uncharacterized protein LOC120681600 isoform X5 [Panicum virgatum]|uniref:uncharacterized protein LOC120681600 isoform X5 n=1 Tax=Panicum virgatum TaxID=38727 RepID=UPI0019D5CA6C|nr:uncharacterized protein LOC120681600 isoform X5 [Panicum virgatum]